MTDDILNKIIAHTDVVLKNWTQTVSVIHAGQLVDISSAGDGRLSTIPVKAPIKAMVAPLRPYGCVFAYSGGAQ